MAESVTLKRAFTVRNSLGVHVRTAAMFVRAAHRYRSEIGIEKDGQRVNGKSILGLTSLMATKGSTLTVSAQGEDAERAIDELGALIDSGFGEP